MRICIFIEVDDGDPSCDPSDPTGLTNAAFERLSGHTDDHGPGSLSWLGDVQSVVKMLPENEIIADITSRRRARLAKPKKGT